MIQIAGSQLCQWDVGRSVNISDSKATHVHFANQGDSKAVIIEITNGAAKIPDYLLQTGKALNAYAVLDGVTLESRSFAVCKRERPENYVYEDDRRNYIYELITRAEDAVENANRAIQNMNEAAEKLSSVCVTVTDNGEGDYVADLPHDMLLDAHNAGRTVYCQWGNRVLSLLVASKPFCAFGCVHGGNVHSVTITAATVTVTTTPLASGGSGSGEDGITPHIGANGNWWIGDEDTGVKAAGGGGASGIHIGSEPPTDENAVLWINPEGEPADFVPTPSTASIGQTIVVKEVDENGKPTEWEAADFPPGGGGGSQNFSTVLTSDAAYRMITVPLPVNLGKALIFNVHITFPSVETEFALVAVLGRCYMTWESKIPVNSKEVGANLYAVRHTENIYHSGTTIAKDYTYAARPQLGIAGWLNVIDMDNTLSIYPNTDGVDLPAGTKIEVWGICE